MKMSVTFESQDEIDRFYNTYFGAVAPEAPAMPGAPEAPAMPEAPEAPDVAPDVDSAGIRWDIRIHASTRSRNQDGTWKKRRGVDAGLYDQVMTELSGQPAPVEPVEPVAPVVHWDFPTFVSQYGQAVTTNPTVATELTERLKAVGLTGVQQLITQPQHIGPIADALGLRLPA